MEYRSLTPINLIVFSILCSIAALIAMGTTLMVGRRIRGMRLTTAKTTASQLNLNFSDGRSL